MKIVAPKSHEKVANISVWNFSHVFFSFSKNKIKEILTYPNEQVRFLFYFFFVGEIKIFYGVMCFVGKVLY